MEIVLNGVVKTVKENSSLSNLINSLNFKNIQFVVVQNHMVIHDQDFKKITLKPGDTIDFVSIVGGG